MTIFKNIMAKETRQQRKRSAPGPPKGKEIETKASRHSKAVAEPKPSTSSADPDTLMSWNGEKIANVRYL